MQSRHNKRIALAWGTLDVGASYTKVWESFLLGSAQACKTEMVWSLLQADVQ